MELLAMILFMTGLATILFANIWFLVVAFKENVLWGLGCLFFPVVSFFFLIVHWQDAKKPFGISCVGVVLMILAVIVMKATGATLPQ